jgi:hypothetical protein
MRKVILFFVFIFCHDLIAQEQNLEVSAELVWVESSTNDNRLMFSHLSSGTWSEPIAVYYSENFISTPTISTDLNQNKLLIWSEQSDKDRVLMSARNTSVDGTWREAKKINNFRAENLSPSIVIDSGNRPWVFWSSNYQGLDDIYYSRQEGEKWTAPQRVHASNKVPDVQPIASLNQDLDVVVNWKSYDLSSAQYLAVHQIFTIDSSSKSRYKNGPINDKENSISDIILPGFLPFDSAVGLHFPNNQIEQSIRLDLNR